MSTATPGGRYGVLVLATVALALAGYLGYLVYPRFDLPSVTGAGLLVLAAGAGVASFFSPCSFPLLVSMLGRPLAEEAEAHPQRRPTRRALTFAAAMSLGAAFFLLAAGSAIALGGSALFEDVTFTSTAGRIIRAVIGALLIALGLIQLDLLAVNLRRIEPAVHGFLKRQAHVRRHHPVRGYALFGFGYLLAGFG